MGLTYGTFKLVNSEDVVDARRGIIKPEQMRVVEPRLLIDTGAHSVYITDELARQLGLVQVGEKNIKLGGGERKTARMMGGIQVLWKNRCTLTYPLIMDGQEPTMGVIVMEALDLAVDPVTQTVKGAHGDEQLDMLM
jgi:predicted aspartyl protease